MAVASRQWLRRLDVRDFRNLVHVELTAPAEGIAVVGDNGQGKTNLLEAVYYLHLLRSARGARDVDVVRFGSAGFHIRATTESNHTIAVGFERAGRRKRATIDGATPARLSDALGALPCVLFSPTDVELVRGAPSERRRYLDIVLGVTSRPYLRALQAYRTALAQRSAALRAYAGQWQPVAVWDPPLAEHGATLVRERAAWIGSVAEAVAVLCAEIGEPGRLELSYASQFADTVDVADAIRAALAHARAVDLKRGATQVGPHRDDIRLVLDGQDLRAFGSAGQQRTAAIALRIVEASTLREHAGAAPLFLLDDPFAELDARRAHRILGVLAGHGIGQTLLAVPRLSDIPAEMTRLERWSIAGGVLQREAA
jgi:DNA replication and repair protein RecF